MSALDPNRYAAPAEEALLRDHIAEDEAARPVIQRRLTRAKTALRDALNALRVAQEAVDSARSIHDDVLAIQEALELRLQRSRGLLHPVRRPPDEVISMIFHAFLDVARRDYGSPTQPYRVGPIVAAVCVRWRRVALYLPALWQSIRLDLDTVRHGNPATWVEYITTFLARSSARPVDLHISGPPDEVKSHDFWNTVSGCFPRCSSIYLGLWGEWPSSRVASCFNQHAPLLEGFELHYNLDHEDDSASQLPFFGSAPLLRRFHWQGPKLSWQYSTGTYPAVTRADIYNTHIDAESLGALLDRMPNIRKLTSMTRSMSVHNTPPTFALSNNTIEELSLLSDGGPDADVMRRMTFHALWRAEIEVDGDPLAREAISAMFRHTMPGLRDLSMNECVGLALVPGLGFLSRLRSLTLSLGYDDTAVQFLDRLSQPDAGGRWLCPRLARLLLPSHELTAPIRQAILRVARARGWGPPDSHAPRVRLFSLSFTNYSFLYSSCSNRL